MNYYNEYDPKAAAWLRELIAAKLIPAGVVDERSITEISPHDLSDFTQCHFFAGIGGWSLALQLAEWPATRPVWTGSCPCQPFSSAGQQKAQSDARHLWPAFFALIRECRPERVFGEQVASAIGHGWLDGISEDLESEGYACGAVVLGAHSVCAPHIRQRLYWLADRQREGLEGLAGDGDNGNKPGRIDADAAGSTAAGGATLRVAYAAGGQREQCLRPQGDELQRPADDGTDGGMAVACDDRAGSDAGEAGGLGGEPVDAGAASLRQAHGEAGPGGTDSRSASSAGWMANSQGERRIGDGRELVGGHDERNRNQAPERELSQPESQGLLSDGWSNYSIVHCRDGKARRFEPKPQQMADGIPALLDALRAAGASESEIETALETFPLAQGIQGRVGLLRGYGNAIVPQVAAEFILASLES